MSHSRLTGCIGKRGRGGVDGKGEWARSGRKGGRICVSFLFLPFEFLFVFRVCKGEITDRVVYI